MAEPLRPIGRADESTVDNTTDGCNDPRDSCRAAGRTSKSTAFPLGSSLEPGPPARIVATGMEGRWKGFLLATILDVVYQLIVHRAVYTLELLITAVTLAIVPYVLFRGPLSRIAKMVFAARPARKQPSIQ